jgi:crossover junction endodeoxyribonuclease RusA
MKRLTENLRQKSSIATGGMPLKECFRSGGNPTLNVSPKIWSGVMREYLIRLPWPSSALSGHAKGHWRTKHDATKAARHTAFVMARQQQIRDAMPDAELHFTYHPPSYRGDVQNVPHMLKAYIDGIADAMGCDDKGFKVFYPHEGERLVTGARRTPDCI